MRRIMMRWCMLLLLLLMIGWVPAAAPASKVEESQGFDMNEIAEVLNTSIVAILYYRIRFDICSTSTCVCACMLFDVRLCMHAKHTLWLKTLVVGNTCACQAIERSVSRTSEQRSGASTCQDT